MPNESVDRLVELLGRVQLKAPLSKKKKLAQNIFRYVSYLTEQYALVSPPLWHNFLVNIGIKERGLCFHWSDALYLYLRQYHYDYFSFYLVGANIGEYFLEHNALLIAAKDADTIKGGVLIDPWRYSGKLYFSIVEEDKDYKWRRRKKREIFVP